MTKFKGGSSKDTAPNKVEATPATQAEADKKRREMQADDDELETLMQEELDSLSGC